MSIKQFQDQIIRFLESDEAEVLCITGKWGVGKTYAWNHYLAQARSNKKISLSHYSYVSLFGQNSLNEVRYSIFEQKVHRERAGIKPDLSTLKDAIDSVTSGWRSAAKVMRVLPRFGGVEISEGIGQVGFFSVRNQIICLDDLERAGAKLELLDVLGLASFLKEERGCKIVLLLNEDALEGTKKINFNSQLEKVADTVLTFSPTPSEAAEMGVDKSTDFHEILSANCIALGLVNIRIIKRIERHTRRLADILKEYDNRVLKQAIHSVSLFISSRFLPDIMPSMEFIKSFNLYKSMVSEEPAVDPQHAMWRAMLLHYRFTSVDEFDDALLVTVQQGHIDSDTLRAAAEKQHRNIQLQDKHGEFDAAWRRFHDSFDDNALSVLDGLEDAIMKCSPIITPANLAGSIGFLKEMGRTLRISALIEHYIKERAEEPRSFWDLSRDPFGHDIRDPDVVEAFRNKLATVPLDMDAHSILISIGKGNGWSAEQITFLASLPPEQYRDLFKNAKGDEFKAVLYGALTFRTIVNSDHNMRTVTTKAEEALRLIAAESDINAKRVARYLSARAA